MLITGEWAKADGRIMLILFSVWAGVDCAQFRFLTVNALVNCRWSGAARRGAGKSLTVRRLGRGFAVVCVSVLSWRFNVTRCSAESSLERTT